jgi:hypothetical protein
VRHESLRQPRESPETLPTHPREIIEVAYTQITINDAREDKANE